MMSQLPSTSPFPLPDPQQTSRRERSGCGSPVLLGCGFLLVLLLVASAFLILSEDRLFRWGFGQTRATILAALPAEMTVEEQQRLEAALSSLEEAVTSGGVDAGGLQLLGEDLREARAAIRRGTFGREEALVLSARLEQIVGGVNGGRR